MVEQAPSPAGKSLRDRLREDLAGALKAGEHLRVSTLRLLEAALVNEEIVLKRTALSDDEALRVLDLEAKRRKEAAEAYAQAHRADRADTERRELAVISRYLPAPLGDEELERVIRERIAALGASGEAAVGPVMKDVMGRVRGLADGARVKAAVSRILAS